MNTVISSAAVISDLSRSRSTDSVEVLTRLSTGGGRASVSGAVRRPRYSVEVIPSPTTEDGPIQARLVSEERFSTSKVVNSANSFSTMDEGDYLSTMDLVKKPEYGLQATLALAFQSVGVIYGDIGTSPLYVYSSTFTNGEPSREELLGALSLILWTLTLVVTVKYALFVLRADDEGEGGTFALYSLLSRHMNIGWRDPFKAKGDSLKRTPSIVLRRTNQFFRSAIENSVILRYFIFGLSVVAVCLVLADGALTPAQSVLGSIQGLQAPFPSFPTSGVVGISAAIIALLFFAQPFGTSKLGSSFAPVVVLWLLFNLVMSIYNLIRFDASVFNAFNPYWAVKFFEDDSHGAWLQLGGVLLAFTGVEAMFADLGHFSRRAIQLSWCCFVYPCLMMAYIGQAAYISMNPGAYANPFFNSVPTSLFWPSFILAIAATIVASQAMISACFSVLSQAMSLSAFPPLRIIHTSKRFYGQIYIPVANWILMIATIAITVSFNNTTSLGNAYGACVVLVSFITTIFVSLVSIVVWRWHIFASILFFLFFGTIDVLYLSATMVKVPQGAWFTLAVAAILSTIMFLWRYGKQLQWTAESRISELRMSDVVSSINGQSPKLSRSGEPLTSLKGVAIIFDHTGVNVPPVFSHFLKSFNAMHDLVIFVHMRQLSLAVVPPSERFVWFRTTEGNIFRVIIRLGYKDYGQQVYGGDTMADSLVKRLADVLRNSEAPTIEIQALEDIEDKGVVYLQGHTELVCEEDSSFIRRFLFGCFKILRESSREGQAVPLGMSLDKIVEVGMVMQV